MPGLELGFELVAEFGVQHLRQLDVNVNVVQILVPFVDHAILVLELLPPFRLS